MQADNLIRPIQTVRISQPKLSVVPGGRKPAQAWPVAGEAAARAVEVARKGGPQSLQGSPEAERTAVPKAELGLLRGSWGQAPAPCQARPYPRRSPRIMKGHIAGRNDTRSLGCVSRSSGLGGRLST